MNGFVYQEIFWLFLVGSVLGVVVEGCWCRFRYGRWRTHVVALWGPFNIVYGIGIAVFYLGESLLQQKAWPVRVAALALAGSLVEYLCGLVIRVGIRMKAWDYQAMAPDYEREQILLREKREQLTAEIAQSEEIYENMEKFLPVIWKYTNLTELTAHVLNELIEKIVVHEKAVAADGSKSQQVDIYYKFIGCINRKRSFASYAAPEKAALQEHLSSCSQTA